MSISSSCRFAFLVGIAVMTLTSCRGPQSAFAPLANVEAARQPPPVTRQFKILFNLGGAYGGTPLGLTQATPGGRLLYGMAKFGGKSQGGTFYSVSTSGHARLYRSFRSAQGEYPNSPVIALNGLFYGLTSTFDCGNEALCGTMFAVPLSGRVQVVHRFRPRESTRRPRGGVPYSFTILSGAFYGLAGSGKQPDPCGLVFSLTPPRDFHIVYRFRFTGGYKNPDGCSPESLIAFNGMLYGTTGSGGSADSGTIFSLTPAGKERVLYSFLGGSDGMSPISVTAFNGKLYGLACGGNTGGECDYLDQGCGTIFSVETTGHGFRTIYRFQGNTDGSWPLNALTAFNGELYGTTRFGGRCTYCGTIFRVSPSGRERVLYSFLSAYAAEGYEGSGLTLVKSTLYGTIGPNPQYKSGAVYAFTP